MKAKPVTTHSASAPSLIRTSGDTNPGSRRTVWLLAVVGLAALIPEAAAAYTVTICTPTGGTVVWPSPGVHLYYDITGTGSGVEDKIDATPAPGFKFVRWSTSGGVTVYDPTGAGYLHSLLR